MEFARAGSSFAGTLEVVAMGRLRESMARQDGSIDYEVRGELTDKGHESLVLKVSGTLWLKCQRCLEALPLAIGSSRRIVFARRPLELERDYEDDETDVVDSVEILDVAELIEDEVLLSLPPAPKHELDVCGGILSAIAEPRLSPFAVLGKLARPPAEH
ncbi:MAG: YceD family protein [Burkholderiales bacterium]